MKEKTLSFKEYVLKPSISIVKWTLIMFVCFIMFAQLTSGLSGYEYLVNNTKAYWKLENMSDERMLFNLTDGSTNSEPGLIGNGRGYNIATDHLNISTSIIDNQDFMICGWIKPNITGNYGILTYSNMSTKTVYAFDMTSGNMRWYRTRPGISSACTTPNGTISANVWNFFCVGYDGSYMNYYINGTLKQNCSTNGVGSTTVYNNLSITRDNPPSNSFTGIYDEFMFFNKTLTQGEVSFLFNNGTPTDNQQYPFGVYGQGIYYSPCNTTITLNSSGVSVYFNYTPNFLIQYGQIIGTYGLLNYSLANSSGNSIIYSLPNGLYNIYIHESNGTETNTSCTLTFCTNTWTRKTEQCIDGLRLIDYEYSCPIPYDNPYNDTGLYEDCTSPSNTDRDLWLIILLFGLWILCLILGLTVNPLVNIVTMIISFALAYYTNIYFENPMIAFGLVTVSAMMFFVSYMVNKHVRG